MPTLLDIDLKQVAHVVERRSGETEESLLLDRARLGVALNDDQPLQHGAIFARHFLPGRFADMFAARDSAVLGFRRKQNAPAIFRHLHIVELRPALRINRHSSAQIDHRFLEILRDEIVPPVDVTGVPFLQRLLDPLV